LPLVLCLDRFFLIAMVDADARSAKFHAIAERKERASATSRARCGYLRTDMSLSNSQLKAAGNRGFGCIFNVQDPPCTFRLRL
jgi:hypothetical protein